MDFQNIFDFKIESVQKIEKGFCYCDFCSWKQRTFDSIPKPFYIRGTNCEGNIEIIKKNMSSLDQ